MHFTHSVYKKNLTPLFPPFRITVVRCANLVVSVWKLVYMKCIFYLIACI